MGVSEKYVSNPRCVCVSLDYIGVWKVNVNEI